VPHSISDVKLRGGNFKILYFVVVVPLFLAAPLERLVELMVEPPIVHVCRENESATDVTCDHKINEMKHYSGYNLGFK
jgi:hypothetical protein